MTHNEPPVVAWSTARVAMNLAIQRGWASRQVGFSSAFVQAALEVEVCVGVPAALADEILVGDDAVISKLDKSLHGLVRAPHSWCQRLKKGLNDLDFKHLLF
jgi:hypothetical protein